MTRLAELQTVYVQAHKNAILVVNKKNSNAFVQQKTEMLYC